VAELAEREAAPGTFCLAQNNYAGGNERKIAAAIIIIAAAGFVF